MALKGKENWSSGLGVILAVAGSAVGLGNFLKFPGQVAMYGGASFMIAYVISFFLLGLPIAIVEWTIGRHGGSRGFNSPPGLIAQICPWKNIKYAGILGVLLTTIIYCYYIYIESWCLGYAVNFAAGGLQFNSIAEAGDFFGNFIGAAKDGSALGFGWDKVAIYFAFSFALNFCLIYRGVSKGIEFFCKYAMPTLVLIAIILVIRVMTLGNVAPEHPERSINQGLGFMWNPVKVVLEEKSAGDNWVEASRLVGDIDTNAAQKKVEAARASGAANLRIREISVFEQLLNPSIWIAAAGQVFFSLTVGFGAIMTYASYLKKRDDIVLSAVTSSSANEFCEVCLGGLITVPAAVAFFGVSGVMGAGLSLFDLGFRVLPLFFAQIPLGAFFGFLFFFLLYLAAVTSSLSMLQPGIAFIEEAMNVGRKASTLLLGVITFFISGFVVYFSKDLKAMDTFDFWMGQVAVYVFAMIQVCLFAWVMGARRGVELANYASIIKLPKFTSIILSCVTPFILIAVFSAWIAKELFGLGVGANSKYVSDILGFEGGGNTVARICMAIMITLFLFFAMLLAASKKYNKLGKEDDR